MPRTGSVYTIPNPDFIPDTTIESAKIDANFADIALDLNTARPIAVGGTGGTTAAEALTNLGGASGNQVVTNYTAFTFVDGFFTSATGATQAPPTNGSATQNYMGWATVYDANNIRLEAYGLTDKQGYTRFKSAGTWDTSWTSGVLNPDSVSNAILANMAPFTVKANNTSGTVNPIDATVGNGLVLDASAGNLRTVQQMSITVDGSGLKLSGDVTSPGNNMVYGTGAGGVRAWKADPVTTPAAGSITNAMLANMAQFTVKARQAAGSGVPSDATLGNGLTVDATSLRPVFQMSITITDALGFKLVNDATSPGNNFFYGTSGAGTKGWFAQPAAAVGSGLIQRDVVTTTGAQTITIPTGCTKAVVKLWGGTGGSGGASSTGGSGGSGGPGYLEKFLTGLVATKTLTLTVGTGGAGGNSTPSNGIAGGDSTLVSGTQAISTLTAGGSPGTLGTSGGGGAGGAGGTATGGDLNVTGAQGGQSPLVQTIGTFAGGSPGYGTFAAGARGANQSNAGNAGSSGGCIIEWYS